MARRAVAGVQGTARDDVQPQVQLFRAPKVRRLSPDLPRPQPQGAGQPRREGHLSLAEGLRMDAQAERRRDMRPRGGDRQDADNVHGSTRDEAAGPRPQADDYRAESP